MNNSIVEIKDLTKSFLGKKPIFSNANLKIEKSEFLFLTGISGSGKSTLMKLITGLQTPDYGEIIFDGEKVEKIRPYLLRRKIGFVYQDYKLLEERSVWENIILPLQIQKNKAGKIDEAGIKGSKFCMIDHLLDQKVKSLSGGEKQLVAICRATIHQPGLIFADEPTANLDRVMALKILALFQAFQRTGTTVMIATHDIELIKSYRARILLIKNSQIQEIRL